MRLQMICILPTLFLTLSCGSDSSTPAAASSAPFDVYTVANDIGPRVAASGLVQAENMMGITATWSSGNPLYTIYTLIKEYINNGDTASQGVDGSNMYVAMASAQDGIERAFDDCSAITAQTISTVFSFGAGAINSAINYDCAYNATATENDNDYVYSYALKSSAPDYYLNMGWYVNEGTQDTPQSLEVHYDDTDKTLELNSAYLVSYSNTSTYNVRINLSGSMNTHLFTLKLLKSGTSNGTTRGYTISIVGYGLSEGGYYLFKVRSGASSAAWVASSATYYCIPSDATTATLQAMPDAGYANNASEITTNCGSYVATVDAATMFSVTDDSTSDAADAKSEFVGSGASGGSQYVGLTIN